MQTWTSITAPGSETIHLLGQTPFKSLGWFWADNPADKVASCAFLNSRILDMNFFSRHLKLVTLKQEPPRRYCRKEMRRVGLQNCPGGSQGKTQWGGQRTVCSVGVSFVCSKSEGLIYCVVYVIQRTKCKVEFHLHTQAFSMGSLYDGRTQWLRDIDLINSDNKMIRPIYQCHGRCPVITIALPAQDKNLLTASSHVHGPCIHLDTSQNQRLVSITCLTSGGWS